MTMNTKILSLAFVLITHPGLLSDFQQQFHTFEQIRWHFVIVGNEIGVDMSDIKSGSVLRRNSRN